jgi:beta-glucanase (GH16 family)
MFKSHLLFLTFLASFFQLFSQEEFSKKRYTAHKVNSDVLVWSDEFDADGAIDDEKWFHQTQLPSGGSWYNGEIQHYTNRLGNSYVNNGALSIVAKKETFTDQGHTKQYTSARLNSKYAFQYGRVEVRAKLPTGDGTWPAIWMLGRNIIEAGGYWTDTYGTTPWPSCGEIDIMEHWGNNQNYISSAMHTPSSYGGTINHGGQTIPTASSEFHVYELDWNAERMIFSVDGVTHYTYNPDVKDANTWPYDAPQYFLLNIAIEPSIASSYTESSMDIDYVRVYEPTPLDGGGGGSNSNAATNVHDDFEGNGTITTWAGDNVSMDVNFANPYIEGINTSSTVLKYEDMGGQYANVRFDTTDNFDLSTNSTFALKIYVPSSSITGNQPNQISLKLQDGTLAESWTTQSEIIKPIVLDQWQEVEFDFANDTYVNQNNPALPTSRTDFNRIVLQVNSENNNNPVIAYIDDFDYDDHSSSENGGGSGSVEGNPVYDDFEGNGTITTWAEDQSSMDINFANPYAEGINNSATVLKYEDTGGQYANVRFDTTDNFDLSTNSTFALKIYVPSSSITGNQPNQISLKLQDGTLAESWTTQSEIIKPIVLDQWQEVEFDFANDTYVNQNNPALPTSRTDFNRIVLQVNSENNNNPVIAYIDDFNYAAMNLSVTNKPPKDDIQITPNPTQGDLYVKGSFEKLALYTITGKKLYEGKDRVLHLESFSKGMYLLRVQTGKTFVTSKIIKK